MYTAETYMTEVVMTAVLTHGGATVIPLAVDSETVTGLLLKRRRR